MPAAFRLLPLLLLAWPSSALSPKLSIRQYSHTAWTEAGGEPLSSIQAFAQTRDGYLWLGTASGYRRFDGIRFSRWPAPFAHRLPPTPVRGIAVARDGATWLATDAGLARIQGADIRHYPFPWTRASLSGIFEDSFGVLWIAVETETENYIQSLSPNDGSVRHFGPAEGTPQGVSAMAPDGGAFWLGGDGVVCRWIPGAPAVCRQTPGHVVSLAPAGPGVVYAASSTAIYRVSPAGVESVASLSGHAGSFRRRALLVDRQGNLWAGTTSGLLRVRNGATEKFARNDGLSGDFITGILEDAEGDIWIATNNGIDRLRDPRVRHISTVEGLSGELTTVVKATADGSVWVGTFGNGLNRIRGDSVTRYSIADGLPANTVSAIEEDDSGRVWVACGEKLAWWKGGRFVPVPAPSPKQPVYAMAADSRGRIWAAGNGLWRVSGQTVEAVDAGQPDDLFRVFASRRGPLWLSSLRHGVTTLSGPDARVSPPVAGLGDASSRAILEDPSGAVWIAAGSTLSRIRAGKVTTWGPAQGLAAGDIYGLTADHRGNLWLATVHAVLRVAFSELEQSGDSAPRPARFVRYDEKDGLRPSERGGMPHPRITTDTDGRIWLCERDGVGVLDPEIIRENSVPPPVAIEQLVVDGVPQVAAEPRFRGRQLQIVYTANSLMAPERVRFRYRMDGNIEFWTDAQGRRELTFVDLPPGNYRFRVSACNLDDVCNEAGAVAPFVVMPFYYQTLWFKFVLSALAWGVIWGGYKLRMRQVVSRYRLVAADRARVTREIHDSLLQGFAGVVLQLDAAARLFHSNPNASKERLDRALDQADDSLREARQMLLDLRLPILEGRPLSEALDEVGEVTTRGTAVAFALKIRGNERPLPYSSQVALYLIGREAIRNAVAHASPSRVSATIAYEDRECCLRVQDDGRGFDLETEGRKPGHLGVQGMGERAKEAGARFRIETAPGAGTTVEVIVSYKSGRPSVTM